LGEWEEVVILVEPIVLVHFIAGKGLAMVVLVAMLEIYILERYVRFCDI
jgi:hypothetical protein